MKIVIGTPYFYPKMGGLENYAYKLAKGLQNTYGWDVVVITSNHTAKKNSIEKLEGMKIYRLAPLFRLSNTPVHPLWIFKVFKIIQNEKPDIINAHTPVPFMADVLSIVSIGIPFILTYHATSLYKKSGSLFNSIVWLYKQIENIVFIRSDIIITVSPFVTHMLPKQFQKKAITISNFVDESIFAKKAAKKENTIVFVGSLDKTHAWKGLDRILKAVKLLVDAYGKQIKLLVIGDGNYKKEYEKIVRDLQIEKSVQFLGKVIGKQKDAYIKRAKIAVMYPNTSNDALPTFLLEAWASKTSVVASDIYPISKIIKNNVDGRLVQSNNASKLAQTVLELLENTKLRNRLEANGYSLAKNTYSYHGQLKKFNALLRKAAK